MSRTRKFAMIAGGAAAGLAAAAAFGVDGDAQAARGRGVLSVQSINVAGRSGVAANEILEVIFSSDLDPGTVSPATVQVRAENATGTGYTKQVFGTFQVSGNVLRFYPRLPTHLRDENGAFYTEGSANDDAADNSGFHPATNYLVTMVGRPAISTVRSTQGRPLRRSTSFKFSTAAASSPDLLYTTRTFTDSPPPQYAFSNPADTVPSVATQYATRGGTKGVPNDISVQLYCSRVPLSPSTARVAGNVTLTMLERYDNPALRRPVQGSVFIEQNYDTSLLSYRPRFPLADRGLYALRVSKNVKDLTEQYDFLANRERERLRQIYDFLSTARANSPATPPEDLPDPPQSLVGDWPPVTDTEARGVLKANILSLGDQYPDEFDPRTMVIFTTRDEPVTNAEFRIEFLKSENLFDAQISTGEWDLSIPGAASAIFTAAGGSAVNGDFNPTSNTTLNAASYPNHEINFRDVLIPQGVTVTVTGTRPVTIKAINFTLNGTIDLSGRDGAKGLSQSKSAVLGGAGGPGGGKGGDSDYNNFPASQITGTNNYRGKTGSSGVDTDGGNPTTLGGQGGTGGYMATGTYYMYGGGGGGGGARLAGSNGQAGTSGGGTFGASWNGAGGTGGASASIQDLNPLFGGAGGGAGGNGGNLYYMNNSSYNWYASGSAGGGGGGAILIQTARALTISTTGLIRSRGGRGNDQIAAATYYGTGGPGGGGGGGSVLLRSTSGFNIANPGGSFDVSGGQGGLGTGSYQNRGGNGGAGFLRTEDPFGGIALPSGSQGTFDPVGGGVPSFVYSKWADLGVEDPRMLAWTNSDVTTQPTTNDAVYVEVQMTREDPAIFGSPDTTNIDPKTQNSTNTNFTSPWMPVKIHDRTGIPGGAFVVPGWNLSSDGTEYAGFDNLGALNGKGLKFIRFRIYFQLDQNQRRSDPMPSVDYIITHYQYNL